MKPVRTKSDEASHNEEPLPQDGNDSGEIFDPEWEALFSPFMAQLPALAFAPTGLLLQPSADDGDVLLRQHAFELNELGITAMDSAHFDVGQRLERAFSQIAAVFGAEAAAEICGKCLPNADYATFPQPSTNNPGSAVEEWIQHLRETGAWILAPGNA